MFRRLRASAMVLLAAMAFVASTLTAQESRGTLQGRVFDPSGGALPGATVEVLNIATGVVTPTTTNEEGSYRMPFLNPGTYRVTVSLTGFGRFISDNIEVHVADLLTVDAWAARQLVGGSVRPGLRLVPARVADRRHDEPPRGVP